MRTDTLAVVFTDIKGYTAATSSQTYQENARMLRRIERLIAPVVRAYNGRIVKSIGDAYMIVFRSPTQAVQCAAAIQDRIHQHNNNTAAERSIHIRVAMNIGEVRVQKGDVFGEPVNIAARIEAVTPADEVYLSEAIYLTMNRTDLPTNKVGEYDLKGIPEPVTVYQLQKFAHLQTDEEESEGVGPAKAAGLPFGGSQLEHWRRVRWVRRAYHAMWILAVVGVCGAAYLRYRPSTEYGHVLAAAAEAVQQGQPLDALAITGEIPPTAVQERALARRHRRDATALLLEDGQLDTAEAELNALLHEDARDAEALMLRGILLGKKPDSGQASMAAFAQALALHPALSARPDVIQGVVQGYAFPGARDKADALVEQYLQSNAVPTLVRALEDPNYDRLGRSWIAARLDKLGAGNEVDWVVLAIADLKASKCTVRKAAIKRLIEEADERAVGPLMKHAESRVCASAQARRAAQEILRR